MTKRTLDAREAAQYLGVGRSHFYAHIRKHLPAVDLKPPTSRRPMWRYKTDDLEQFLQQRTRTVR